MVSSQKKHVGSLKLALLKVPPFLRFKQNLKNMKKLVGASILIICASFLSAQDLKQAMIQGDLTAIRTFVEKGNELDAPHIGDTYTLLCAAAKVGDTAIANYLLRKGASTEVSSNGKTPLMYAAKYGQLEIAELLLKSGAEKEVRNEKDASALDYAKRYQQPKLVDLLSR